MSATRRDFLAGLTAASALAALPRAAAEHAPLYPPVGLEAFLAPVHRGDFSMRAGCAAITWNGKDTQAIEDIAALGYDGIQLRANAVEEFPDPHALRDLLAQHKLTLVALSSGQADLDPWGGRVRLEEWPPPIPCRYFGRSLERESVTAA